MYYIVSFIGRRVVEAESEFSQLDLAEDEVVKSIYENQNNSTYSSNSRVIRSDGGNVKDNSVANPNIDVPKPEVGKTIWCSAKYIELNICFITNY